MIKSIRNNQKLQNTLEFLAKSKWMDLIGIGIIIVGAGLAGWFTETLGVVNKNAGAWGWLPFGLISTFAGCLSLWSDRLDSRMNKLTNWVSLFQTLLAMWIDYQLGNKACWTYLITFAIYLFATYRWSHTEDQKTAKPLIGTKKYVVAAITIIAAVAFSLFANYLGFHNFSLLYWLTSAVFAMSLIANVYSALKLDTQFGYWQVYNLLQIAKYGFAMNAVAIPQLIKYIYYLINVTAGQAYWRVRHPEEK